LIKVGEHVIHQPLPDQVAWIGAEAVVACPQSVSVVEEAVVLHDERPEGQQVVGDTLDQAHPHRHAAQVGDVDGGEAGVLYEVLPGHLRLVTAASDSRQNADDLVEF
jgi:hypothetical protein